MQGKFLARLPPRHKWRGFRREDFCEAKRDADRLSCALGLEGSGID